ncbi:MAG: GNAT family N-acetyltransferase [Akkermansiaceae bacterium]|nr:GNAT family N-acetyltransferase [Armatimonadota bacterium]
MALTEDGIPLGFANYVLHPHTWSDKTLCYLEDLYVSPKARGRGVGHALIEHLIEVGKTRGWGRVYWHTETGNAPARRLYDRFKAADDFVRYTVSL